MLAAKTVRALGDDPEELADSLLQDPRIEMAEVTEDGGS
jgi:hypothetical protein